MTRRIGVAKTIDADGFSEYNSSQVYEEDVMEKLFPVYGVVLGKMTIDEIIGHVAEYDPDSIEDTRFGSIVSVKDFDFRKPQKGKIPSMITAYKGCLFPDKWAYLGFSWSLSYSECIDLLENMGFVVKYLCQDNTIYAISSKGHLAFVFEFSPSFMKLEKISLRYLQSPNCDIEYISDLFFPICGVYLGTTDKKELRTIANDVHNEEYNWYNDFNEEFDMFDIGESCVFTDFGDFSLNDEGIITEVSLNEYHKIPGKWAELGISWDSSRDEIANIFETIGGFSIDKYEYSNGDGCVSCITDDDKLDFDFEFSNGKLNEMWVRLES